MVKATRSPATAGTWGGSRHACREGRRARAIGWDGSQRCRQGRLAVPEAREVLGVPRVQVQADPPCRGPLMADLAPPQG
jgi:hypothetical protein